MMDGHTYIKYEKE